MTQTVWPFRKPTPATLKVKANQCIFSAEKKSFFVDASELGLPPGKPPLMIYVEGRVHTVTFKMYSVMGDQEGWLYHADTCLPAAVGMKLVVWND